VIAYTWTPEKLVAFKQQHEAAVKRRAESFKFDGYCFYVEYAKYLIQYLEQEPALQLKHPIDHAKHRPAPKPTSPGDT